MPIYTFPYGASAFGTPQIASGYVVPITTGNYFFVSSVSGSNSNNGLTPATPFATIKYAAARCLASNYDVIVMMPGHAETINTAAYITPVAGTTLCGIGTGTLRPTLTFSITTATIVCSAANLTFQNFVCTAGVAEVVTMFSCSAADITFNGVDYNEVGGAYATLSFLVASSACNRLAVQNCYHINTTVNATSSFGWIHWTACDGVKIWDNVMLVNRKNAANTGPLVNLTTATTNISILRNTIGSMTTGTNNVGIALVAASTGIVAYNVVYNLGSTALLGSVGVANCFCAQNFAGHTVYKSGILDPVVDA